MCSYPAPERAVDTEGDCGGVPPISFPYGPADGGVGEDRMLALPPIASSESTANIEEVYVTLKAWKWNHSGKMFIFCWRYNGCLNDGYGMCSDPFNFSPFVMLRLCVKINKIPLFLDNLHSPPNDSTNPKFDKFLQVNNIFLKWHLDISFQTLAAEGCYFLLTDVNLYLVHTQTSQHHHTFQKCPFLPEVERLCSTIPTFTTCSEGKKRFKPN